MKRRARPLTLSLLVSGRPVAGAEEGAAKFQGVWSEPGTEVSVLMPRATALRWESPRRQLRSPLRIECSSFNENPRSRAQFETCVPEATNCSCTAKGAEADAFIGSGDSCRHK